MNTNLPGLFFLAPMAELTTPALRQVVRRLSPGVVLCSEMLSAGAVATDAARNRHMQYRYHFDDPYVYQVLGNEPGIMAGACRRLTETGCASIDINMGCSAPDIVKTGSGTALLKNIRHAREIVRRCREAATCMLSVKMRSGFARSDIDYIIDFARMLEDEGVNFITMHPRHGKMAFRRKADWDITRTLAGSVNIPVVGNGDIISASQAVSRLRQWSCAAIMIGRAAVTEPWIFAVSSDILNDRKSLRVYNIHKIWLEVLSGIRTFLPRHLHKSRAHRFCFYYSKNVTFHHQLFTGIRNVDKISHMQEIINEYFFRNPAEAWKEINTGDGRINETDKI